MSAPSRPWRVSTVKASKARHATRHWALGPNRQSAGWFATPEEAQAYCDRKNAEASLDERGQRARRKMTEAKAVEAAVTKESDQ